jgi:hypothetical protein
MKPSVAVVMQQLIEKARTEFPFNRPEAQVCNGPCQGCSMKLLGYLESELDDWEARLAAGERPGLADLSRLVRSSRRIARVLANAGLMPGDGPGSSTDSAGDIP